MSGLGVPVRTATASSDWATPAAVPGGAILVGRRGKIVAPKFFGRQGPEPDAAPIVDPATGRIADVEVEDFSRLPGPHVTPEHMWRLARRAAAWLERPDIDGLVITHGTDTIEETAFFLDLVLTSDKPVVLVGAMRTVSDASWDGPANLLDAVRVAAAADAHGRGVLIVMNEQILPARDARKIHTEAPTSFAAPEFGPIGIVDTGLAVFRRSPLARRQWRDANAEPGLRVQRIDARVELLQVLAAFCLGARESDLHELAHLGRPASERLDELAQAQAACGLGAKAVLMNVLHGRPYTTGRAPSPVLAPFVTGIP